MQGLLTANEFISPTKACTPGLGCTCWGVGVAQAAGVGGARHLPGRRQGGKMFARESLRLPLLGMNADLMCKYVDLSRLLAAGVRIWDAYGGQAGGEPVRLDEHDQFAGEDELFEESLRVRRAGVGVAPEEQVFKMDAIFNAGWRLASHLKQLKS